MTVDSAGRPDLAAYRESTTTAFPELVRMLTPVIGKKLTAYVAGVNILGFAVQAMNHLHHFHEQRLFVRPMVVDGRLAHAGRGGDGIHAGRFDSPAGKKFQGCFQNSLVRADAAGARHNQIPFRGPERFQPGGPGLWGDKPLPLHFCSFFPYTYNIAGRQDVPGWVARDAPTNCELRSSKFGTILNGLV